MDIDKEFPRGVLRPELFLGVTSFISARSVAVNLSVAGESSGLHYAGGRYGRGEVGEFVLIEGQQNLLLGRITEVGLREPERRRIRSDYTPTDSLDAIAQVQLLGCVSMHNLGVTAGVDSYPRLGDRVYSAPHRYISLLPVLMERQGEQSSVVLDIGYVGSDFNSVVSVKPERFFGRHCAILGATGGGKSWTTARIVEECLKHKSKIILLDATGEYRGFSGEFIESYRLGGLGSGQSYDDKCSMPPSCFIESDFIALFEPSGKVQGPKLRAAIESLRLAAVCPDLSEDGIINKTEKDKEYKLNIQRALFKYASVVQDPGAYFDVSLLTRQIVAECVYDNGDSWGRKNDQDIGWCAALISRINSVMKSPVFDCVFNSGGIVSITDRIDGFIKSNKRLLRICLGGVGYEYKAREIIANTIGRYLLRKGRSGVFIGFPVVIIVDEAHNFLGKSIGSEDHLSKLDAFEIIAKEGRKYCLNICLATQRPRDITEGVLSQMGTLVVHRLTNDQDRLVVERACGEIDRAASAFLPNLRPGEAAVIGVDFPIPMTVQVKRPNVRPFSDGPDYQNKWAMT